MLRIAKKTRRSGEDVFKRATAFFGTGGEGLQEAERNPCCLCFEGAGGYVTVSYIDEDKHRVVEVETREFEYPVKRFLQKI